MLSGPAFPFLKPRITRMSRMIGCGRIRSTGILPAGPAASRLPNRLINAWQDARSGSSQLTADESDCGTSCPERRRMGLTGLEPVTLRLSSACSNQLSYRPGKLRGQFIVRSEIRNAISENWRQGDYAPASASENVPFSLNVASTSSRLWRQGDSNP
jgi:hypothetical protein